MSRRTLGGLVTAVALSVSGGCGGTASAPPSSVPDEEPVTIDGIWLLEGTNLVLDIVEDTAVVDARSDCARVIGSLTFTPGGDPTSFSLPGRDVTSCSTEQADQAEQAVSLLEEVTRVEAGPSGLRLVDRQGRSIGLLRPGA